MTAALAINMLQSLVKHEPTVTGSRYVQTGLCSKFHRVLPMHRPAGDPSGLLLFFAPYVGQELRMDRPCRSVGLVLCNSRTWSPIVGTNCYATMGPRISVLKRRKWHGVKNALEFQCTPKSKLHVSDVTFMFSGFYVRLLLPLIRKVWEQVFRRAFVHMRVELCE